MMQEAAGLAGKLGDVLVNSNNFELIEYNDGNMAARGKLPISFERLLQQLPYGITVLDPQGRIVWANKEAKMELWDGRGEKLAGRDAPGKKALRTGRSIEEVVQYRETGSGEAGWARIKAIPLTTNRGKEVSGVVNVWQKFGKLRRSDDVMDFLNKVSETLVETVAIRSRLKKLARMLVPALADWCVIDMVGKKQKLETVVMMHANSDQVGMLKRWLKVNPDRGRGIKGVIETGEAVWYPGITAEVLAKEGVDEKTRMMVKRLDLRSLIMVPIKSRGKTRGVITCVMAESGRVYDEFDFKFLKLLAVRASAYVENAWLYDNTRKELARERKAQKELAKSEERLNLALGAGQMAVWDWDVVEGKVSWSGSLTQIYGWAEKEKFRGMEDFLALVHPGDRDRVGGEVRDAVNSGGVFESEFRTLSGRGVSRWMAAKAQIFKDEHGQLVRMTGIATDVTERKISEEILVQSEKKFRTIFENNLDAMLIVDDEMRILDMNPAASGKLGYSREELLEKGLGDLVVTEHPLDMARKWESLLKKGIQGGELEISRGDGQIRLVEYSAAAAILPNRNLVVMHDATERILEEKRQEHFLGIASHELRSPLMAIRAYAEILRRTTRELKNAKALEYLEKIDNKVEVIANLINDLMDVTRIKQGKLEINMEELDLDKLVLEVVRDMRLTMPSHNILRSGRLRAKVWGDRARLTQVLANLVRNAVKYSPQADKVIVRVGEKDDEVVIRIQDFGWGIKKEEQKKVFNLYYRGGDERKLRTTGMGVGLFISAAIVKQHGGKTWVVSRENEGSTFYVTLPKAGLKPMRSGRI